MTRNGTGGSPWFGSSADRERREAAVRIEHQEVVETIDRYTRKLRAIEKELRLLRDASELEIHKRNV